MIGISLFKQIQSVISVTVYKREREREQHGGTFPYTPAPPFSVLLLLLLLPGRRPQRRLHVHDARARGAQAAARNRILHRHDGEDKGGYFADKLALVLRGRGEGFHPTNIPTFCLIMHVHTGYPRPPTNVRAGQVRGLHAAGRAGGLALRPRRRRRILLPPRHPGWTRPAADLLPLAERHSHAQGGRKLLV